MQAGVPQAIYMEITLLSSSGSEGSRILRRCDSRPHFENRSDHLPDGKKAPIKQGKNLLSGCEILEWIAKLESAGFPPCSR